LYNKENEERKIEKKEEKRMVKNYFDKLLTGKDAEERIKLLSTRYKNRKI